MSDQELSEGGEGSAASSTFSDLLRELAAAPAVSLESDWTVPLFSGQRIGRFELVRELGRGGFGVVYEALDTGLGRRVALKAARAGRRSSQLQERLLQEAEAAARLNHPNIVTLYDFGRCDHGPYLILELLLGESLHARMARGAVPVREAVRIALEVARGLAYAHAHGVVHRDLTPGNVFLGADGAVKVLDFGLAHAFGRPRIDGGTPAYMSPEQWCQAPEDERTDVFAFGVILYRMLSGKYPFPDDGGKSVRGPDSARPLEIPASPALARLVGRMLAQNPVHRPRDGQEVLSALSAIHEQGWPTEEPRVFLARRRPPRRAVAFAAIAAVALFAAAAARHCGAPEKGRKAAVVVADCVNPTGDPDLDALSGLLIASLEQSSKLTVLTRSRILDVARERGHDKVERIDEVLGLEVARQAGAAALLAPTVHRLGATYAVELRAIDPQGDRYLFPLRLEAGSKDGILTLIDQLSDAIRSKLGEAPESIATSRIQARGVAGTLEAYRHYFAGQQHFYRWELGEAEKEYQKALAADPDFALAHVELEDLVGITSRGEEAGQHLAAALEHLERLPLKHRKIVLLAKATADRIAAGRRETEPVLRQAEEMISAYPEDKDVLVAAARALWTIRGRSGRGRAMELLREVLRLEPARMDAAQMLTIDHLLPAGRCLEALLVARGVGSLGGPMPPVLLAGALACNGQTKEALEVARRAAALGPEGERALIEALVAAQKYEEAGSMLEKLTGPGVDPSARRLFLPERVRLLAMRGRRREALKLLDQSEGMSGVVWDQTRKMVLDTGLGRAWRIDNVEDFPRDIPENQPLGLADRARAERRLDEAVRLYREFSSDLSIEARVINDCFLAELLIEGRHPAEALAQLGGMERALLALSPDAVPRAIYLRALANEQLGRRDQALAEVQRLLHLWSRADSDLRLLIQANEVKKRLESASWPVNSPLLQHR